MKPPNWFDIFLGGMGTVIMLMILFALFPEFALAFVGANNVLERQARKLPNVAIVTPKGYLRATWRDETYMMVPDLWKIRMMYGKDGMCTGGETWHRVLNGDKLEWVLVQKKSAKDDPDGMIGTPDHVGTTWIEREIEQ